MGRFTVDKKYICKSILISFILNYILMLYDHDKGANMLSDNSIKFKSLIDKYLYSRG